jgi:hypothetical protein
MKTNVKRVGLEVEFLLRNAKGEIIVPPKYWDRDGFPVLAEIRGEPGTTVAETISSFWEKYYEAKTRLSKGHSMLFSNIERIRLAVYREAMKQVDEPKHEISGKIKNINGVKIEDYSDQILKNGKIQGVNASCGLHVHFSCGVEDEVEYQEYEYEPISIPIGIKPNADAHFDEDKNCLVQVVTEQIFDTELLLYRRKYQSDEAKKKKVKAFVSQLNRPTTEWIVGQMDEKLFKKFAPPKDQRTKFRQAGFYELKDHGFEYRSLPANEETLKNIDLIVETAFTLLDECAKRDW